MLKLQWSFYVIHKFRPKTYKEFKIIIYAEQGNINYSVELKLIMNVANLSLIALDSSTS